MKRESIFVRNLTKSSEQKLNHISLMAFEGEILAFTGNHGSGISTLVNILTGQEHFYTGTLYFFGIPAQFSSLADANSAGIYYINNKDTLFPDLSVAENICITYPAITNRFWTSKRHMETKAQEIFNLFELNIDPKQRAYQLDEFESAAVAIVKHVLHNARILILDNIIQNCNARQQKKLHSLLKKLTQRGITIILISMIPENVIQIANRILLFVQGQIVGNFIQQDFSLETMNTLLNVKLPLKISAPIFSSENKERLRFSHFRVNQYFIEDLCISQGDCVEITDRQGYSIRFFLSALLGTIPYTGQIFIDKIPVSLRKPGDSVRHQIACLHSATTKENLFEHMTVRDNLLMQKYSDYSHFGFINQRLSRFAGNEILRNSSLSHAILPLKPKYLSAHMRTEVTLARLRAARPKILLLDDPLLDADSAMRSTILNFANEMRQSGVSILVFSTSKDEFASITNRSICL